MVNVPPITPLEAPALPNAPMMAPAQFAANSVGKIAGFLGALAGPVLTLALAGMGLKMIITGEKPKFLK